MLRISALLSALWIALLCGCVSSDTQVVDPQAFVETKKDGPAAARELQGGDTVELSVEVDGMMEVSFHRAALNDQGVITLPLVGDVKIGGLTMGEARAIIGLVYGDYYVNPPVIMLTLATGVEVTEWGFVTVMGRVNNPGRVAINSSAGMNLTAVIQQAGGFSASAKTSEIQITRVNEEGKKLRTTIDFEQIGRQGNASSDVKLIDGDIIFIPQRIF